MQGCVFVCLVDEIVDFGDFFVCCFVGCVDFYIVVGVD